MDVLATTKIKEATSVYRVTWTLLGNDRKVKFFANPLRAANFKTELTSAALLVQSPFIVKPTIEKVELE